MEARVFWRWPGVVWSGLLLLAMGAAAWWFTSVPGKAAAPPKADYDSYVYGTGEADHVVDFGTQPASLTAPYSEALLHDEILKAQLAAAGWTLREHPYRSGKDLLPYVPKLDVMILGDIPAFLSITSHRVGIFALVRQGYNSLIARQRLTPSNLKGLRIGYPPLTSAHFTVERALDSAGLTLEDVVSVSLQPDELQDALQAQKVDVVAAWEPNVGGILSRVSGATVISTSDTYTYVLLDLDFLDRNPELGQALLAALVRAARWSRLSDANVQSSLVWAREAGTRFLGASSIDNTPTWGRLLRKETINNPSFPLLPLNIQDPQGLLRTQFEFLLKTALISSDSRWQDIRMRVEVGRLPAIVAEGVRWRIDEFHYGGTP